MDNSEDKDYYESAESWWGGFLYTPEFPRATKTTYIDEYRLQHWLKEIPGVREEGWGDIPFVSPWYSDTHSPEKVLQKKNQYLGMTMVEVFPTDRSMNPLRVMRRRIVTIEIAGEEIG